MTEITVQELKEKKESNENFLLLDVREDVEYMVSNLGGQHIPLGQLNSRLKELEEYKKTEIVVLCRSGNRSSQAASFLKKNGFEEVKNLQGGIKKWADEIDPSIPVM
jgi:rhodanese-related sulfurtransferase